MIPPPHAMTTSSKLAKPKRGLPSELEGFSFRAVIDWIEIELTLHDPSQWHAVKRRAYEVWGNLFVESLESVESSKKFRLRVQDPRSPDEFFRQLLTLARAGESLTEDSVRITGVEIAMDASHPSNDPDILARAALYLMRHQATLPIGLPRITAPAYFDSHILAAKYAADMDANSIAIAEAIREGREPPARFPRQYGVCPDVESGREALRALRRGLTINQGRAPSPESGERGDSYRSRTYVKTKDTRDSIAYDPLPVIEHRTRTERTRIDLNVPFSTIEEWRNFRFETLAQDFALVLPVVTDNPLVLLLQDASIQLGRRPDSYKIRPSDRRKGPVFTRRDSFTNDKFRQALRALTRAQSCQNSVTDLPVIDLPSEGKGSLNIGSPKYSNNSTNTNTVNQSAMIDQSSVTSGNPEIDAIRPTPPARATKRPLEPGDKRYANGSRAGVGKNFVVNFVTRLKAAAQDFLELMSPAWRLAPG